MLELQNHPDAPCGTDDDRVDLLDPFTVASFETLEQQLRPFAHMALETLADTNLRTRPTCTVANIAKHFTGELPLHGESLSGLAERLATTVTPFGRNKRSPRYFAQMDVPPSQLSVFAGLVIRAIAQDPIAFSSSRSGTFVEKQLTQWLSTLIYGAQPLAGGVMTTGGSQSNLQALLLLRNAAFARRGIDVSALGLADAVTTLGGGGLVLLASERAHESILSAARFIGLGDRSVTAIKVRADEALDLDALHAALLVARGKGQTVMALAMTACTTGSGAIDPLREAALLAREFNVPVHVDAAHGGMFLFSPTHARLLDGIELATTVTLDPHKILGVNQALGFLAVSDTALLEHSGKVGIGYYVPGGEPDLGRWSLDNSRSLESLSGWLMLRALGRSGYARIVDHFMVLTEAFCAGLEQSDDSFELLRAPTSNVVAFRSVRQPGETAAAQNARNEAILRHVLAEGAVSISWYEASHERKFLRAVFVNPASGLSDVQALVAELSRAARLFAPALQRHQ